MKRTIFFVKRVNPERYKILQELSELTADTVQPPGSMLGISITGTEIDESPPLPVLRRCLVSNEAFPEQIPQPGCQFIALLCLKPGVDRSVLLDCTLEEALALCETYDSGDFAPV